MHIRLPVGKRLRGIGFFPGQVVPVRDMLTDAHDQLARTRLLQVDLPQQAIGGRTAGASSEVKGSTITTELGSGSMGSAAWRSATPDGQR